MRIERTPEVHERIDAISAISKYIDLKNRLEKSPPEAIPRRQSDLNRSYRHIENLARDQQVALWAFAIYDELIDGLNQAPLEDLELHTLAQAERERLLGTLENQAALAIVGIGLAHAITQVPEVPKTPREL